MSSLLQDQSDCLRCSLPFGEFGLETLSTRSGQRVVLGPAIVLRSCPLRSNEAAELQTVQCRVKRPLPNLKRLLRELLNALRDAPSVHRFQGQRLEDQQ